MINKGRAKALPLIKDIKRKERINKMFRVMMLVDGEAYEYGKWADRNKANEIAMKVRAERGVETFVEEN